MPAACGLVDQDRWPSPQALPRPWNLRPVTRPPGQRVRALLVLHLRVLRSRHQPAASAAPADFPEHENGPAKIWSFAAVPSTEGRRPCPVVRRSVVTRFPDATHSDVPAVAPVLVS